LSDELSLLGESDELLEDPDDVVDVNALDVSSSDEGKSSSYVIYQIKNVCRTEIKC
jgi:hypothetical protein